MNGVKYWAVVMSLAVCIGGGLRAEEGLSFDISADYLGKYIWRGHNLDDDPVFQPAIGVSYGGVTASVWGNLETTGINGNSGEFTELNYTIEYSGGLPGIEGVGYSVGAINYHFPSVVGDTTEIYWGLAFDVPLDPSVTFYHDIDEVKGTYASFGIGHSFEKIAEITPDIPVGMDLRASLGWGHSSYNADYWGVKRSKLNDLVLSVSFPIEIGGWTVTASLKYMKLVSGSIRSGNDGDVFFGGIGFSRSF
ncbi:MAG: hypothetical protein JSU94_15675 [Phycisphaerales bacterium]|nr:MAG: hypothetical protein JSU94_15675 [Phycisphaerales bacterium]